MAIALNYVTVLGSMNIDTILQVDRLPLPGETRSAKDGRSACGGKGANQAVAAARAGAHTSLIGKVGDDLNGKVMIDALKKDGIDTSYVAVSDQLNTGEAFVFLDDQGQNSIVVYGGANQNIGNDDIDEAQHSIGQSDFLLTQLETPEPAAIRAFEYARAHHVITVLNPAPAKRDIHSRLLKLTNVIIPNELESETITGIKITDRQSMRLSAEKMMDLGVQAVIITLGARGAYFCSSKDQGLIEAFKVTAVDTTAAGDTFIGALCSRLNKDLSNLADSIIFANTASSLAVQKLGAQPSIPTLEEIRNSRRH